MLAGPNGAGKTTAAENLLPKYMHIYEFVNADSIAFGISPFNYKSAQREASEIMLERIKHLTEQKMNFAFETTGAGKTHIHTLNRCRELGYHINLVFLYLPSPELAIERVRLRVLQGKHDIPKEDIIRRYKRGLDQLVSDFIPLANLIEIYDNSENKQSLIAEKSQDQDWVIHHRAIWQKILEHSHA